MSDKRETRGRKKDPEINYGPEVWTRKFEDRDGSIRIMKYDNRISKNGPISCEITWPNDKDKLDEIVEKSNPSKKTSKSGKVFLTSQKWINPKNGKEVGYTRAKMLGLI